MKNSLPSYFRAAPLLRAALGSCFLVSAAAQSPQQYALRVNGNPVATTRPATRVAGEWFVPLAPVARALGDDLTIDPGGQSLRVLRSDGVTTRYDAATGQIVQGSVLMGQLVNFRQVLLNVGVENLAFPLDGVVALFGVTVRENPDEQVLEIGSLPPSGGGSGGGMPYFQVASLEDRYGLESNGQVWQQFVDLRGQALMGNDHLSGDLGLTHYAGGGILAFQQGFLRLETPGQRVLTVGDQGARTGVEALMNAVRGLGYEWRWGKYVVDVYGGRGASSTSVGLGSSGLANYDSDLTGFGLRRKSRAADFSLAANAFRGPRRSGATIGTAYSSTYARNDFKVQGLLGYFSGFSLQPVLQVADTTLIPQTGAVVVAGSIVQVEQETQHVKGAAYGFSVVDSFTPFKSKLLLLTGLLERYSRDFLVLREDSRFSAVYRKSLSANLRPSRYISFMGSVLDNTALLGPADLERGYTFGVNASVPGSIPLQAGYFRSVETNGGPTGIRFVLSQYSVQMPAFGRYSASFTDSEAQFGSLTTRSYTETFLADFKKLGRLGVHDQLQVDGSHNYGMDWTRQFGRTGSYVTGGLERQTSPNRHPILSPVVALRVPLFRRQTLTLSYLSMGGSGLFRIEIGGPILRQNELTGNVNTQQWILNSPSTITGQVYYDVDYDGQFKAAVDRPLAGTQVWLDETKSTTADAGGYFRFDGLAPGSHRLRVAMDTLPANLLFAHNDVTVAVLPYRANREDFRAIPTGSIEGKVTIVKLDETGREMEMALPDARITATGNRESFAEGDGSFLFGDLPPGRYQLQLDSATVPASFVSRPAMLTVEVKPGQRTGAANFRLVRPVIVKSAPPASPPAQATVAQGVVEGFVWEDRAGGRVPARGVTISIEDRMVAISDGEGHYLFPKVPEGVRQVALQVHLLPDDLGPGPETHAEVTVAANKNAQLDFEVYRLLSLHGKILRQNNTPVGNVSVRLMPLGLNTTSDANGVFHFDKVREGDYEVYLDQTTLPHGAEVAGSDHVPAPVRVEGTSNSVQFQIRVAQPSAPAPIARTIAYRVEARVPEEVAPVMQTVAYRVEARAPEEVAPITQTVAYRAEAPLPEEVAPIVRTVAYHVEARAPEEVAPVARTVAYRAEATAARKDPTPMAPTQSPGTQAAARQHNLLGRQLTQAGNYRGAIAELGEAIRLAPDFALAYNARGYAWFLLRDYAAAIEDLSQAIRLNPNYANAHQLRGLAKKASGDLSGAAEDLRQAK